MHFIAPTASVLTGAALTAYGIYASHGNGGLWLIAFGIGVWGAVVMYENWTDSQKKE